MKTISLFLFLTFSVISQAQIGVVTINNAESSPVGQWFSIRGEDYENTICYYDFLDKINSKLDMFLKDYGMRFNDAELDEEGNLSWGLDNNNGFFVTITLVSEEDMGTLYVLIYKRE